LVKVAMVFTSSARAGDVAIADNMTPRQMARFMRGAYSRGRPRASHFPSTTTSCLPGASEVEREKGMSREVACCAREEKSGRTTKMTAANQRL